MILCEKINKKNKINEILLFVASFFNELNFKHMKLKYKTIRSEYFYMKRFGLYFIYNL